MELPRRIIYSRFIFSTGIVLLVSLSALFLYETYQENASTKVVRQSNQVRESLEKVLLLLSERQSAFSAYLLTGDTLYRAASRPEEFHQHFAKLESLVGHDTIQSRNLRKLKALSRRRISKTDSLLSLPESHFRSNARPDGSMLRHGASGMDSIRSVIDEMQSVEFALSRKLELDAQKHTIFATLIGIAASMFSMIVFILAFYFIDQELKRSQVFVNEAKALNKKIGQVNREVEQANRSLQQLNNELETKNFQLEKYAKEISSFTHITSHDMQEPLRKIEFFISVIQDREQKNLSEEGKKTLQKVSQSVLRMRKLFLSMLEFSMTNTVDNQVEVVDLNEVLQITLDSLKIYIKDSNATIEAETLPKVNGVKYQFIHFFENIISNAIKFRRKDIIPELIITCETIDPVAKPLHGLKSKIRYHRIDFKDNGIGFDPMYKEKIFEIFQRLLPGKDTFGVGIGLTISRKIAENHGGILIADSQPNSGSTFSLFIPVISEP
jgi:signal transduction histidine kinase